MNLLLYSAGAPLLVLSALTNVGLVAPESASYSAPEVTLFVSVLPTDEGFHSWQIGKRSIACTVQAVLLFICRVLCSPLSAECKHIS